jgi:plastocyanin
MSKVLLWVLGVVGILAMAGGPLMAQVEPAPTAEELTLRPGDTISWAPASPHRMRFGGTVTHKGAPLPLTTFAALENLIEITPKLTPDANGIALAGPGEKVTASVKSTAAPGGEFFFTCGFPPHTGMMVAVAFKIAAATAGQPARNIEIVSANPPRWLLKTPGGDKSLNRP